MKQVKAAVASLDSKIGHVEFNAWKYDIQEKYRIVDPLYICSKYNIVVLIRGVWQANISDS